MKSVLRLLFSLILLATAFCTNAQSLWNGTEYGMSLDQVKASLPHASSPAKPGNLADGAEELLRLEDIKLVNERFTASFYFKGGKLTQVTLSLAKRRPFNQTLLVFNQLTEALRAKYGQEISREIKRGGRGLNAADATWMSGRTNINVLTIGVGENDAILNINYQTRVAHDADKL